VRCLTPIPGDAPVSESGVRHRRESRSALSANGRGMARFTTVPDTFGSGSHADEDHRPVQAAIARLPTLLDASRIPRQTGRMTSTRIWLATASRAMSLAPVAARSLGVASMPAYPVVDASRSPGQGPPALR